MLCDGKANSARPTEVLTRAMGMRTCNSCQLLNLVDISLPLLPHGRHVCSHIGQLLPATDSEWKVGTQNETLATKQKVGTPDGGHVCSHTGQLLPATDSDWKSGTQMEIWRQNGLIVVLIVENWRQNGELGIPHPTHLLLKGSYAALSRVLNEALWQLIHKAKRKDMLG